MRGRLAFAGIAAVLLCLALAGQSAAAMLDPAFGKGGISVVGQGFPKEPAKGITIDPGGRLIVTGRGGKHGDEFYAARITDGGNPDPTFGTEGYAVTDFSPFTGSPNPPPEDPEEEFVFPEAVGLAPLVQPSGKIVVAGTNDGRLALARFNADGSVDPVFSSPEGGWKQDRFGDAATAIAQGPGGKFLVAGNGSRINRTGIGFLIRYSPEGVVDKSFQGDRRTHGLPSGHILLAAGKNHPVEIGEMKLLGGGRILLGGTYEHRFMVARLRRNGSLDPSFGKRGIATVNVGGAGRCSNCTLAEGMAPTPSGRIVVAGTLYQPKGLGTKYMVLARFMPDGRVDRSFGHRGVVVLREPEGITASKVVVQPDGKIVTVGQSSFELAVVRFNPNGKLDPTFFDGGIFKHAVLGGPTTANDVLIDHQGRIVVAGGDPSPVHASFVMRILPDAGSATSALENGWAGSAR